MSQKGATNAIGIFLAIFLLSLSVALGILKLVLSIASMLQCGLDVTAIPSLRIIIPILSRLGIAVFRLIMACTTGSIPSCPIPPYSCWRRPSSHFRSYSEGSATW
jgi:hypothetical protein